MTTLESFTGGEPLTVDFTAIERELAGLWKEASAAPDGGSSPAVMRACQLNLVVLCRSSEEAARATSLAAQVTRVCPSRVLMAVLDIDPAPQSRAERGLEAFISAHCSYTPGAGKGKQVCCEQITIAARGDAAAARLPGAVLPLLLPDLPVVLWWPGEPDLTNDNARRLIDASDRVVIDSRRFTDATARYRHVAVLDRPVADLAWQRLRAWRELAAGLFDGGRFADYPPRLDTIEVGHAGGAGSHAEALLLGCWASSRLRWRPTGAAAPPARGFTLARPDGRPTRLALCDHPGKEPAGQILSLTLKSAEATFDLRRAGDFECVSLSVAVPEACPISRVARVVARDEATLLCRCLESGGRDDIYDEAVHLAGRMPEQDVPAEKGRS